MFVNCDLHILTVPAIFLVYLMYIIIYIYERTRALYNALPLPLP